LTFKTRFAPSPTGLLHIGNARSAVINWAYSKNKGGEFILRIDDTDSERSKKEYENKIKENLSWLGLLWSKTFNQSQRKNTYDKTILLLKKLKKIYPCFETAEELSLKRKNQLLSGKPPIYDRSSLRLTSDQVENLIKKGKTPHWRFKVEEEIIEWHDLIKGKISFDSKNLSDPVLIREDGRLLYHLPSVVDDVEENITDIIRGEDHITNTAFHIQLFKSLKAKVPRFGHHPFLTDEKGKSFGKRLGSLSIQKMYEDGFESLTLLNYLLSIGTSKNLSKEKNIDMLVNNFNINSLASSSPKFSINVLKLLNKDMLQSYDFSDVKQKFIDLNIKDASEDFWMFIKNNINYFSESLDWIKVINSTETYINNSNDYLNLAAELLPEDPYDETTWDLWIDLIKNKTGKKGKELFKPIRFALTGRDKGPELKYLLPLLTKEHILKKLGNI
jgi:glutamyl-tRNA synthetase